jgi:hypothetical protein
VRARALSTLTRQTAAADCCHHMNPTMLVTTNECAASTLTRLAGGTVDDE